jgi:hypothetical protein
VRGRDILDTGLLVQSGVDTEDVVLTLSERHSVVSGTLQTSAGNTSEYYVIAFSADRTYWHSDSRRLKVTRPANDGSYSFRGLPSGEYWLAVLRDFEAEDLERESFFEAIVPSARHLTLGDGETKTVPLVISKH